MSGLNQCQFIGRLGADPDVRSTGAGKPVVNLRLAVSKSWRDKEGNRKESTTWVPIVIWNEGLCRVAEQYLKKGSQIFVSGEFSVRKWTDKDGADKYSTEVVLQGFNSVLTMLDSPKQEEQPQRMETYTAPAVRQEPAKSMREEMDDDLPF